MRQLWHFGPEVVDQFLERDFLVAILVGESAESIEQAVSEQAVLELIEFLGLLARARCRDESDSGRHLVHLVEISKVCFYVVFRCSSSAEQHRAAMARI